MKSRLRVCLRFACFAWLLFWQGSTDSTSSQILGNVKQVVPSCMGWLLAPGRSRSLPCHFCVWVGSFTNKCQKSTSAKPMQNFAWKFAVEIFVDLPAHSSVRKDVNQKFCLQRKRPILSNSASLWTYFWSYIFKADCAWILHELSYRTRNSRLSSAPQRETGFCWKSEDISSCQLVSGKDEKVEVLTPLFVELLFRRLVCLPQHDMASIRVRKWKSCLQLSTTPGPGTWERFAGIWSEEKHDLARSAWTTLWLDRCSHAWCWQVGSYSHTAWKPEAPFLWLFQRQFLWKSERIFLFDHTFNVMKMLTPQKNRDSLVQKQSGFDSVGVGRRVYCAREWRVGRKVASRKFETRSNAQGNYGYDVPGTPTSLFAHPLHTRPSCAPKDTIINAVTGHDGTEHETSCHGWDTTNENVFCFQPHSALAPKGTSQNNTTVDNCFSLRGQQFLWGDMPARGEQAEKVMNWITKCCTFAQKMAQCAWEVQHVYTWWYFLSSLCFASFWSGCSAKKHRS